MACLFFCGAAAALLVVAMDLFLLSETLCQDIGCPTCWCSPGGGDCPLNEGGAISFSSGNAAAARMPFTEKGYSTQEYACHD